MTSGLRFTRLDGGLKYADGLTHQLMMSNLAEVAR